MLKMWPLCIDAKLNLRILGDVKKDGFISLPGKGGHSRLLPLKTLCPTQEDLVRSFIATVTVEVVGAGGQVGGWKGSECVQCLHSFNLVLGNLMSKEESKSLLKKVKEEESKKVGFKLNIQKAKIIASGPITSWQMMGKQWKRWQTLFSWAPKSLQMVTAAMKLKDACS